MFLGLKKTINSIHRNISPQLCINTDVHNERNVKFSIILKLEVILKVVVTTVLHVRASVMKQLAVLMRPNKASTANIQPGSLFFRCFSTCLFPLTREAIVPYLVVVSPQ